MPRAATVAAGLAIAAGMHLLPSAASAGSINTNAALSPTAGGHIFRLQYHYAESRAGGNVKQINSSGVRATYVHGLRRDLALFLSVPYANRQVDRVLPRLGRVEEAHDGVGDITVMAKYRLWHRDPAPLDTQRIALLAGLNIRSGDSHFSSDSYDPILGAVYTWRHDRSKFDADLIYQLNTGRGPHGDDALRYDLAYSHRLFPTKFGDSAFEIDAVAELNGRYLTDGSHEIFLSPGVQFVAEHWLIEASLQLPVVREMAAGRAETDYRLVLGLRLRW